MGLFWGAKRGGEGGRVPPGQRATAKWPVLHHGAVPPFDEAAWEFRVWGEVEEKLRFTHREFRALPTVKVRCDIHCVTHWTRLDNEFEGVPFREVVSRARPKPSARFGILHCEGGFTTNLPLEVLLEEDVLFAWRHDGRDLAPEHGWPLRLVVPRRYFWKSAKWVRGVELSASDKAGFWERAGYHNDADPWKEERFG